MKTLRTLLLTILLWGLLPFRVQAQEQIDVTRVTAEELVAFLRQQTGTTIFFVPDTTDTRRYTVHAPHGAFQDEAFAQLREGGYSVTQFDGGWYVLRGRGLALNLPTGFFNDRTVRSGAADSLRGYLDEQAAVMTFQNKVYEIGDPDSPKASGRATVRGYVRDVASGEPIVAVSVYEPAGKSYTQTDEYGFYKIMLPTGVTQLGFSGYSLEDLKLDLQVFGDGALDVVMKEKVFTLKGAVVTSESASHHRTPQMGIEKVRVSSCCFRRSRCPEGGDDTAGREIGGRGLERFQRARRVHRPEPDPVQRGHDLQPEPHVRHPFVVQSRRDQ